MWTYIRENKQWIFSGIGVLILSVVVTTIRPYVTTPPHDASTTAPTSATAKGAVGVGSSPADKPLDVAQTALADPEGVPIRESSAAEILAQLESVPPLQRQSISKTYLARHVRWQGQVQNVVERSGRFLLILTEVDDVGPWITVSFDSSWRDKLGVLRRRDSVVFEGKIDNIETGFVHVEGFNVTLAQLPQLNPVTSRTDGNDHSTQVAKPPVDYGNILRGDSPYPQGFEAVRIGTPMSAVIGAYPGGEKRGSKYSIELSTGPFKSLYAYFRRGRPDPPLEAVYFRLKDQEDRPGLLQAAIATFGEQSMTTESLGAIARWSKFPGIRVQIDEETYLVDGGWPEESAPVPQE